MFRPHLPDQFLVATRTVCRTALASLHCEAKTGSIAGKNPEEPGFQILTNISLPMSDNLYISTKNGIRCMQLEIRCFAQG